MWRIQSWVLYSYDNSLAGLSIVYFDVEIDFSTFVYKSGLSQTGSIPVPIADGVEFWGSGRVRYYNRSFTASGNPKAVKVRLGLTLFIMGHELRTTQDVRLDAKGDTPGLANFDLLRKPFNTYGESVGRRIDTEKSVNFVYYDPDGEYFREYQIGSDGDSEVYQIAGVTPDDIEIAWSEIVIPG